MVAPLGTGVAQTDKQFVRLQGRLDGGDWTGISVPQTWRAMVDIAWLIVPTLCVGELNTGSLMSQAPDARASRLHSHAERGNDKKMSPPPCRGRDITSDLATVFWLLSGMASRFISRMPSSFFRERVETRLSQCSSPILITPSLRSPPLQGEGTVGSNGLSELNSPP